MTDPRIPALAAAHKLARETAPMDMSPDETAARELLAMLEALGAMVQCKICNGTGEIDRENRWPSACKTCGAPGFRSPGTLPVRA